MVVAMIKYLTGCILVTSVTMMSSAQVLPNFKKTEQPKQKVETTSRSTQKKVENEYNKPKKKKILNGYVKNYPWKHLGLRDEIYNGEIVNGIPNGKGESITLDSIFKFEGHFVNSRFMSGTIYRYYGHHFNKWQEGTFNQVYKLEGYGIEYDYYVDGFIMYKGQFVNGNKKGLGIYYGSLSAYRYEGLFDNYFIEGSIYFDNGCRYIGKLQELKYSTGKGATGIYYFANNDSYKGEFSRQVSNGQGIYTWANGSKYTGSFESGQINGRGELFNGSTTYRGTFRTLPDGRLNFDEEGTKKHLTFSKSDGSVPFPIQKPKTYDLWW